MSNPSNPVIYFEIPVLDIDRAMAFYKTVFNFEFNREIIDHYEMALFPFVDGKSGISGAFRQKATSTNPLWKVY